MKKLLFTTALLASANVFAHVCHISLYDPYNRPYLNFYSYQDVNCQSAANSCYKAISDNRLNPNYFKCYTISMTDDVQQPTRPTVRDLPVNRPVQPQTPVIASTDTDYRRELERGETVLYQGKQWLVVLESNDGLFELMPVGGNKKEIEKNIERRNIAITRGCLRDICTKTSVTYKVTQTSYAVEGIDWNGKYILKDVISGKIVTDVDYLQIQKTP